MTDDNHEKKKQKTQKSVQWIDSIETHQYGTSKDFEELNVSIW